MSVYQIAKDIHDLSERLSRLESMSCGCKKGHPESPSAHGPAGAASAPSLQPRVDLAQLRAIAGDLLTSSLIKDAQTYESHTWDFIPDPWIWSAGGSEAFRFSGIKVTIRRTTDSAGRYHAAVAFHATLTASGVWTLQHYGQNPVDADSLKITLLNKGGGPVTGMIYLYPVVDLWCNTNTEITYEAAFDAGIYDDVDNFSMPASSSMKLYRC